MQFCHYTYHWLDWNSAVADAEAVSWVWIVWENPFAWDILDLSKCQVRVDLCV